MTRPLYEIAGEVRSDWGKVSPYAVPYLNAMATLSSPSMVGLTDQKAC